MSRVGTSPGLELNGINHNLLRAGSNLHAATAAISEEPGLRLRQARWHQPTFPFAAEPRKVSELLQSYQIDQISESLHQELHMFLQVFAIRLESQEAALSDAATEIRKSTESVICDMQKRFDAFIEKETESAAKVMGQRRAKLDEAGAVAQRLLQELPADFGARFQQVENQLLELSSKDSCNQRAVNPCENSTIKKEEKQVESSLEQMRWAIQLQGLSKGFKSLEERFSAVQSRLSRNEKASQQALAQARHLETLITGLPTRLEDQVSFQNLRRQVREMSKTFADTSLSVSFEGFEELQRKVFALEHHVGHLESGFDALGHQLRGEDNVKDISMKISEISETSKGNGCFGAAVPTFDAKDENLRRRIKSLSGERTGGVEGAAEGLHFADGTVESSGRRKEEPSTLRSPRRSQASPTAATPSRISQSTEEPSWDRVANIISP